MSSFVTWLYQNCFSISPLSLDETNFLVLENEMHQNKISEMRALLPHDHQTIGKSAEKFRESELLVHQNEANKRKTLSLSRKKGRLNMSPPLPKRLPHKKRLYVHCTNNETLNTLLMVSKH